MPTVLCLKCKRKFYAKPSFLKKGQGKYCSVKCFSRTRRLGKLINCEVCGKKTYKQLKAIKGSKSKKYFCSQICSNRWLGEISRESFHPNWKGGQFSYKKILQRSSAPAKCVLCAIKNPKTLAVHHIDKDQENNKINNLAWLCYNCHFLVHHYKSENQRFLKKYALYKL